MGRPKLGYHLKRDHGLHYLIVEGYKERFKFGVTQPTKAEIADALASIRAGAAAQPVEAKPLPAEQDTWRALADAYYTSKQFKLEIDPVTQRARRNAIEALLATKSPSGAPRAAAKVYDLTRKHVLGIQAECFDKPETGNIRVKVLRYMYAYALDVEWPGVLANPAKEVKLLPPKVKTNAKGDTYTGHREWVLHEVERFRDFYRDDAHAYDTASFLFYIGARVSDLYKLGKGHETTIDWRGTQVPCLKFRVFKGGSKRAREAKSPVYAVVPIVPELRAILDRTPVDRLVYLVNEYGRGWGSAKSLGNRMRKWCDAIVNEDGTRPYDELTSHGLRKASANWWRKNYRCSTHELMAIFGWLTDKEALYYTAGYDREETAAGVVVKFPTAGRA